MAASSGSLVRVSGPQLKGQITRGRADQTRTVEGDDAHTSFGGPSAQGKISLMLSHRVLTQSSKDLWWKRRDPLDGAAWGPVRDARSNQIGEVSYTMAERKFLWLLHIHVDFGNAYSSSRRCDKAAYHNEYTGP